MKKVCCLNPANLASAVATHNQAKVFNPLKRVAGTRNRRVSLLFLLGVVFIAAVSPIPGRAQTSLTWSDNCPQSVVNPGSANLPPLQCATLPVPLDYKNPEGPTITLAISRIPADPGQRRGVLLMNPGGPGGEGFDFPLTLIASGLPQTVMDQYDLIGFDPRFLHFSTPMTCGLSFEQQLQLTPPLSQPGGFDATVAFMQNVATLCSTNSGSILPFDTTENIARDMDEIRKALGETTISYLGYSYGTYLGAVYATLFPNHTDRFILDSAVDPQWVWQTVYDEWGLGGQIRFPDFANFAAANNATYGLGNTPDDINKLFFALENQLNQNPVTFSTTEGTLVVNGPQFALQTFKGLESDMTFPALAQLWQELNSSSANATAPSPVPSAQAVSAGPNNPNPPADNALASAIGILCGDVVWPKSLAEYQARFEAYSNRYPMFGPLASNVWPCAFWPTHNTPVTIRANGPSNIMILENRRDPATPYPGALQMNADLGHRTTFVSVDQGGHTVYLMTPNDCANNAATAFLASGTFPGGFVSCPVNSSAISQPNLNTNAWSVKLTDSERERARQKFQRLTSPLQVPVLTK